MPDEEVHEPDAVPGEFRHLREDFAGDEVEAAAGWAQLDVLLQPGHG